MLLVPAYLSVVFMATTLLAVGLFGWAARWPGRGLVLLAGWLLVQGGLAFSGFYAHSAGLPPRFALLLLPPVGLIVALLLTNRGRAWLAGLALGRLTLLHVVRIPVELVLLGLYHAGAVPQLMTFEGRNFDMLAGLTAPLVYWLAFRQRRLGRRGLLLWNLLALGLLDNIVVNALLSAPSPLQRFAFNQPNLAILHFPFAWLPAIVVPLVLLAHLVAIQRLWGAGATSAAAYRLGRGRRRNLHERFPGRLAQPFLRFRMTATSAPALTNHETAVKAIYFSIIGDISLALIKGRGRHLRQFLRPRGRCYRIDGRRICLGASTAMPEIRQPPRRRQPFLRLRPHRAAGGVSGGGLPHYLGHVLLHVEPAG